MKLVQKLPVALAVACVMMMSSCSKEDVQTPEPKVESANMNSNLKVDASTPFMSSTKGYLGIDILPANWSRNLAGYSSNTMSYPTGVSSMKNLWGDPSTPFVQSLSLIPWAADMSTFITVTTSGTWNTSKSSLKTKINNLLIGKKYALTVYVSSTIPEGTGKASLKYAKSCLLSVASQAGSQETVVDLTSYKYCWVQKIVTFTATSSQMDFAFSATPPMTGQYSYAHLLIADNAVKLVN
ncbi:MAG: hypothetical protein ABIN80_24685 [Dyadobacter sp.]|uniref:hypothetical protein n=1 Tax=Dyadobacter sp. TaxID=1914288 RepID=UPI0032631160